MGVLNGCGEGSAGVALSNNFQEYSLFRKKAQKFE